MNTGSATIAPLTPNAHANRVPTSEARGVPESVRSRALRFSVLLCGTLPHCRLISRFRHARIVQAMQEREPSRVRAIHELEAKSAPAFSLSARSTRALLDTTV